MNAGDLLLKLAFAGALLATALFAPAFLGRRVRFAVPAFVAHTLLLVGSLVTLWTLFLGHRFEYAYVSQYSSRALSPALTFAASWAGQEGSILLWVALAAVLGLAALRQPGSLTAPAMAVVSAVQALLMLLLMVKSPFALNATRPPDGMGLNPLLEDPWMVAHPPVLFLGYAALVVPFALAIAALARQEYREWSRMVWPWALFGVVTLGAGIVLGGIWAYKVLGWGGYWGWDPVENASLIPWLVTIALLHGLLIQRTTGSMVRTNLVLASLGWVTVLAGTWLTRSGALQNFSVHSFADSGLNVPLTAILVACVASPAALLAPRWRAIGTGGRSWNSLSREAALWLGLVTVLVMAALVAFGTSAPVLTAIAGKPASVQPAFYGMVVVPLSIALVLTMAVAPALRWSQQSGFSWLTALVPGLVAAGLGAIAAAIAGIREPVRLSLLAITALALVTNAVWMVRLFRRGWSYGAGYLGHVGVGVMVLGMLISGTLGRSQRVQLAPGAAAPALGWTLRWDGEHLDARGEHVLAMTLQTPKRTVPMHPRLMDLPREDGKLRKPALADRGEIYLSVIDIVRDEAGGEPVWLAKGQEVVVGEIGYTFTGFRMTSHQDMQVLADVRVRHGDHSIVASPGMHAGPQGSHPFDAEVPGLGTLKLARIDADRGRIAVIPPGAATRTAVVELSTRPFVNLVWIGALLALIGSVLAGLRRAAEPLARGGARPQPAGA